MSKEFVNEDFTSLNLLNSKSLTDVRRYSTTDWGNDFTGYTTDFFGQDDMTHADKWSYQQFDYVINHYGFRGGPIPNETNLAAFGCSFTFGSGLPDYMLWHDILAKEINVPCVNFGQPTCSIESIVDIFLIISKHVKMKHAVILLPSISRLQIAKKHPDYDFVSYLNVMPTYISKINEMFGVDVDNIYRGIPDEEIYKVCKNQLYLLDHIASERGINVYLSSWDSETYNFIQQLNLKAVILPEWKSPSLEFANTDLARDCKHPGPKHHQLFVDNIKSYIK